MCVSIITGAAYYCEPRLCWSYLVPFKSAQIIEVANLWKPLNIMTVKLCTVMCATVECRENIRVEKRYINRWTNGNLSNDQPQKEFQHIADACGERVELSGRKVVSLMNEYFGHVTVWYKICISLRCAKNGKLNLNRKLPNYRPVQAATIYRQLAHEGANVVSSTLRLPLHPPPSPGADIPDTHFC
jgi:hypothetical protein